MDILALLVILIGVVTLMWIVASYMEIEKLKIIVYGDKNKGMLIQAVGVADTPQTVSVNFKETVSEIFNDEFNGKIPKLEEGKIYYLCHPCTTGSRTITENKEREETLFKRIIKENQGIRIIRPLQIIPENMPHEEAMRRCFNMLDAAHAIILPMGWSKSNGCKQEHNRASEKDIEKIFLSTY